MMIGSWWAWLNARAGWMLATGLAVVVLWNIVAWRRDRGWAQRLRASPAQPVALVSTPPLSVLVAAWNEAQMIAEHIQSFRELCYGDKELLLCAGGEDGTYHAALEQAGPDVVVLEQLPGEGKQGALQRCWRQARGEIVLLTDADCLLDDATLTRTLAPLVNEGEQVTTSASEPLPSQLMNPLVMHLWCTDLYVQARQPRYVKGLLGRSAALTRVTLASVGGFADTVRTGTDYYLAKQLLQRGYRIRSVRESAITTRYPETISSYWRRQSRWVRNLLLHGPRFGAHDEVRAALRTCAAGAAMLVLPWLGLWLGPALLALWALLWAQAALARVRYVLFARDYRGVHIGARQLMLTPWHALLDFMAWNLPAVDLLIQREKW